MNTTAEFLMARQPESLREQLLRRLNVNPPPPTGRPATIAATPPPPRGRHEPVFGPAELGQMAAHSRRLAELQGQCKELCVVMAGAKRPAPAEPVAEPAPAVAPEPTLLEKWQALLAEQRSERRAAFAVVHERDIAPILDAMAKADAAQRAAADSRDVDVLARAASAPEVMQRLGKDLQPVLSGIAHDLNVTLGRQQKGRLGLAVQLRKAATTRALVSAAELAGQATEEQLPDHWLRQALMRDRAAAELRAAAAQQYLEGNELGAFARSLERANAITNLESAQAMIRDLRSHAAL